ncbi:putative polygalacturonate 4-alpha-galacturonosyltransferase [Helianthus debilis subsp. tardiflorus]
MSRLLHNPSLNDAVLLLLLLSFPLTCFGIRYFPSNGEKTEIHLGSDILSGYTEAPDYRNGVDCSRATIHIAMTIDLEYLRGTIAAVHSVLRHASCPENIFFHFIAAEFDPATPRDLTRLVRSTFPSLHFKMYIFREDRVINLISSSIRIALENPLNYARNYLGEILDPSITRVIYLDSDIIIVDDIAKLWNITLHHNRVIGAPEYCHTNFTKYFTDNFWADPGTSTWVFKKRPCYFNTGVMVMDMNQWRKGMCQKKIEHWMEVQRNKRIYELGSLPPFLLVFGGNIEPIHHRWNQHGLGGDNVKGSCRTLHSGPVSLLHWSGKGKPWVRLDDKRPCPLDHLWEPYDLYKGKRDGRRIAVGSDGLEGYSGYFE